MPHHHDSSDESESDPDEITMGGYADLPPEERPGYKPPVAERPPTQGVNYAQPLQPTFTPHAQWGFNAPTQPISQAARSAPGNGYQYAQMPEGIRYTAKPVVEPKPPPPVAHTRRPSVSKKQASAGYATTQQAPNGYHQGGQAQFPPGVPPPPLGPPPPPQDYQMPPQQSRLPPGARVKEVVPGGIKQKKKKSPSPPGLRPHGHSMSGPRPDLRAPSPSGLGSRMNRLSVSGNRPDVHAIGGGLPPPSPLLEAYKGTWQTMSPMPSPLMMARRDEYDDIDELSQLSPSVSRNSIHRGSISRRSPSPSYREKKKKSVSLFDEQAERDARDIAAELSHSHPKFQILIDILPKLSHDQILELRVAYKRVCKIQGRGINIAKHIKLKTSGNLCKIAYVTALGRWESEGYWANFWYQSNSARRELLIEALMGRTNTEIRNIKDAFKDKRYNDDLARCMDKELKADKFRVAVLMALEEKRQEENDVWPIEYRNRDVDTLYNALRRRDGGETAILEIVVMRSDGHLRDCLKTYERKYNGNFAKDALRKSNNLVVSLLASSSSPSMLISVQGEIVAHILNGVINRPARDAMLLHHALLDLAPSASDTKGPSPRSSKNDIAKPETKKDRYELLVSRLVRLHWDRLHFMRVKEEYRDKYGHYVEEDIEDYVRGDDFREFLLVLCESVN
jgi:hypothetical protein